MAKYQIGDTFTVSDAANFYHGERATIIHYSTFSSGTVYTAQITRPSGTLCHSRGQDPMIRHLITETIAALGFLAFTAALAFVWIATGAH